MSNLLYAVTHSYQDPDGTWHEAEFVNLDRFPSMDAAREWLKGTDWQFHHMEGDAEVYLYPGRLCNPPQASYLETQKMFIREVREDSLKE